MADEDEDPPPPITWKKVISEAEMEEQGLDEAPDAAINEEGIPIGEGIMTYPVNNDTFTGAVEVGKRTGKGKYVFGPESANGANYEGEYKENMKEGQGKFTYPDGSVYEGSWKADKRDGEGEYRYASGDVYRGAWKEDKKHGQGSYLFKESMSTYMGEFKDGKFIKGEWIMKDGSTFSGIFSKDIPKKGTYNFASTGNTIDGWFLKSGFFKERNSSIPC